MLIGAVDIGGTKIATALADASGRVIGRAEFPTAGLAPEQALERIVRQLHASLDGPPLALAPPQQSRALSGVGIGCTGPVDPVSGIVGDVDLLPGWRGFNLVGALSAALDLPVAVENDADAAALAEARWGAGRGARSFLYVTVSTGIGAGVIVEGRLYRGVDGAHPELGHQIIDCNGPQCYCGAHGCWESLASGTAMAQWARAHVAANIDLPPERLDAGEVCRRAQQGERWAREAVAREGRYLGLGLANLVTSFCPEVIALGGGVMQSAELFLEPARAVVRGSCGLVPHEKTAIRLAELGADVALAGAAAAWLHRFET